MARKTKAPKTTETGKALEATAGEIEMQAATEEALQALVAAGSAAGMSLGDMQSLVSSLLGPSAYDERSDAEADAKFQAQEIAWDALEAVRPADARRLAKRALKIDPDCVDALLVLADFDAHTSVAKLAALQRAVDAGERSLGEAFVIENAGSFWGLIETRPYMRALENLADAYAQAGMQTQAIAVYRACWS